MSQASELFTLPELPVELKDRLVEYRASEIEENLRALEAGYPGVFGAMKQIIDMLEAEPGIDSITIDYDEDDVLYPATIWARTTYSLDERDEQMPLLEARADEILKQYEELVLVAIL